MYQITNIVFFGVRFVVHVIRYICYEHIRKHLTFLVKKYLELKITSLYDNIKSEN